MNKFVDQYQCAGCVCGPTDGCFRPDDVGIGCGHHVAGTLALPGVGWFLLGLPEGFNRIGLQKDLIPKIFETSKQQKKQWAYDKFNIPIWKHKTKEGHIIVRGYMPRINTGFIHIILKGNFKQIKAVNITKVLMKNMD